VSLIRRRMAPLSMRQTGSQLSLGGNTQSFLSRVVSLSYTLATPQSDYTDIKDFLTKNT